MATTTTQTTSDSDSITLKRATKGSYSWEIKIYSNDSEFTLEKLKAVNSKLLDRYGMDLVTKSKP